MKTTFSRTFFTTAGLILLCMLFLGAGFRALMSNYLTAQVRDNLSGIAASLSELAEAYSASGPLEDDWDFRMNLGVASRVSGTDAVLCDEGGQVLVCSDEGLSCEHIGRTVDRSLSSEVLETGQVYGHGSLGLYDSNRYYVARTVAGAGFVLVSSPAIEPHPLLSPMFRIFFATALVVLLAALATSSILARSQSDQLRHLAAAARRFGRGDLNTRAVVSENATSEMKELAAEFNGMADSLQRSERTRQEFIANVSHELKTPMTSIGGFMDGMLDGTIPPERHRQYMEAVSDEVRRLSRLVRTMLDVSRLQSRGIPAEKRMRFDVAECAGRVLVSFEQRITEKRLEVTAELPEEGLYVRGDRDAIMQVLYNLTENAVKFCAGGGRLWVRAGVENGCARVTVGNTGPTIPPEELPLVFERFHKTDKSRSADPTGYGLGLYIVKTIIEGHGEQIRVTSEDGVTEFTFTLPTAK